MTPFNAAMLSLAAQPNAVFVGQGVKFSGHAMYHDLEGIADNQRIEFPVAEDLQLGFCTGLSLQGFLPICVFPRVDFMMRAMDQLVNHLDKLEIMSCGQWRPKIVIRTRKGTKQPLDAGPQHTQDYSAAFRMMLTNIDVFEITKAEEISPVYNKVIANLKSALVVEKIEC